MRAIWRTRRGMMSPRRSSSTTARFSPAAITTKRTRRTVRVRISTTRSPTRERIVAILQDLRPDVAFNALHGKWGEDGCCAAMLETLQIPYTHSGVLASSLAMHKEKSKAIFREAGDDLELAATGGFVHVYVDNDTRKSVEIPAVIRDAAAACSRGWGTRPSC